MRYLIILLFPSVLFSQSIVHFEPDSVSFSNLESINKNIFQKNSEISLKVKFTLNQNYPNPFNPSTTISYEIKETSFIELRVYDALGNFIKLVDEGIKIPGSYTVKFEAENLSTGVYFYQLISGEYQTQSKMLLLK